MFLNTVCILYLNSWSCEMKDLVGEVESEGAYIAKDGSLVLDFIQAIHAAEKRQAELDARIHSEEKRMLKVWTFSLL